MNSKKAYSNIPVIIPAYEPDRNLLVLCEKLLEAGLDSVIIVDDGSGKEYQEIFDQIQQKYQYIILRHAVNLGKGRALKEAFNYVLNREPNLIGVVTADSDGQHTPEDIIRCMRALIENPENLILGCRTFDRDDIPWKSKIGNELTKKVCHYLCGVKISDTQTGLRGIPSSFMKKLLSVSGERFEYETNMLIECKNNRTITEIPIQTVYESKTNHKTHFDPLYDSIRIYKIFGGIFLKYIFASVSSCILDLCIFAMLCNIMRKENNSVYIISATIIARIVSAIYNYIINYKFVFKSKEKRSRSAIKYLGLVVVQMTASAIMVSTGVKMIKIIPEVYIKAIVDIILFFLNYFLQQRFIF